MADGTLNWLRNNAKCPLGHPDGWEIPLDKLDEFNAMIRNITIKGF